MEHKLLTGILLGVGAMVATALEANLKGFTGVDFFENVFYKMDVPMAIVDIEGRPFLMNNAAERFFEYTTQELRHKKFEEFTHPEDIATDVKLFNEILDGKREKYFITKRWITKSGRTVWGLLTVTPIESGDSLIGVLAVVNPMAVEHDDLPTKREPQKLTPLPKKSDNFIITAIKEFGLIQHPFRVAWALGTTLFFMYMFAGGGIQAAGRLFEVVMTNAFGWTF